MSIGRYSWASGEELPDCAEKRFILGFIIQLIQDAQVYGNAPPGDRVTPEYLESVSIHAQCVTGERFRWWCEVLNMSPWRLAAFINDVMFGKEKVNTRQLRVGKQWEDYDSIGFQAADPAYVSELARRRWGKNAAEKTPAGAGSKKGVRKPGGSNRRVPTQPA